MGTRRGSEGRHRRLRRVVHDPGRRRHRRARGARAAELPGLPRRAHRAAQPRLDPRHARGGPARRPAVQLAVGVLFIDLDNFKLVNDSLGHAAGDEVLALVADRIASVLRPSDRVGRFGGDEFVVVVPDVANGPGVEKVAERMQQRHRDGADRAGSPHRPDGIDGHRGLHLDVHAGQPAARHGLGAVPGQVRRTRPMAPVRRGHARAGDRPAHARGRAAPRGGRARVRRPLPADRPPRRQRGGRARGAGPLAAPQPGAPAARRLPRGRRGVRHHRGDRAAAARRGLRSAEPPTPGCPAR